MIFVDSTEESEKQSDNKMQQMELNTSDICEELQSADRRQRQRALKSALEFAENEGVSEENLEKVYNDIYLHLLKCYSDKFESCREQAVKAVSGFIKRLPRNDFYLQNAIVTLSERIGKKEIIESSEEMRLVYLQQTNFLIQAYGSSSEKVRDGSDSLKESYNYIVDIILKTLTDPYPAVQKEACACVVSLSTATSSFHIRAEALTLPLYPLLHHKHAVNRITSVAALGAAALHVHGDSLVRVFTEISPLLMDSMPLVREECGKVGCKFLMQLKDRYSYFERIIPLVLCCLKDESPDIQNRIRVLWIACGQQYFEENEAELSKIEMGDSIPELYPDNVQRPTLGCRALVQRSLRITKLIMRETTDWKEEVRLHALKLLYQFALHAEETLTAKFFEIYPELARACADQETMVANEACKVANLLGRLLKYDDWIEHGLEGLSKNPKLGHVKCFAEMLEATNGEQPKHIQKVAEIISGREFCHNLKPQFQVGLLKLIEITWDKQSKIVTQLDCLTLGEENWNEEVTRHCYEATLKIMAISIEYSDQQIIEKGQQLMHAFASKSDVKLLHSKYLRSILNSLDAMDSELDGCSEPIIILHGIIRIAHFQKEYIDVLKNIIKTVWDHSLPDGKVKIMSAVSISMLRWSEFIDSDKFESTALLKEFVQDILVPHITWHAGAAAESMRALATSTLCAMVDGAPDEAPDVLSDLSNYFPSLIEDRSVSTRLLAIKCFQKFGPTSLEKLKPIAYAILQRLDDPSATVREWAARVICKLETTQLEEFEQGIWNTFLKRALELLLLHFDGPEIKLKAIITDTLKSLAQQHPDIARECLMKAKVSAKNDEELKNILNVVSY